MKIFFLKLWSFSFRCCFLLDPYLVPYLKIFSEWIEENLLGKLCFLFCSENLKFLRFYRKYLNISLPFASSRVIPKIFPKNLFFFFRKLCIFQKCVCLFIIYKNKNKKFLFFLTFPAVFFDDNHNNFELYGFQFFFV